MKKLFLILTLGVLTVPMFAQTASDALRYSRILYGGTARFQGLAGAMGAVGADFSVISTNPAGLGIYKSSEVTFTPSFWISHSSTDYNGVNATDNRFNFALGNWGFVMSIAPDKKKNSSGLKNFNFAIGINRQNDFNNRVYISGPNNKSSLLTDYANILNNQSIPEGQINNYYPFDIALAYNSGLVYYDSATNRYANDAPNGGVYQTKAIYTHGSMNEFDFAFGANVGDKLYFGATIGVPFLRYYETSDYIETKTDESIPYFRSLDYYQTLETHGTGINFKVGVIYRPANWVRIGAAIHTPTFYGNMRDRWSSSMYAAFDSAITNNTQYSPLGEYNYMMTTPFRAIGSVAFIIGPYGLISAEYEYVNYNQAKFNEQGSNTGANYSELNTTIKDTYRSPLNLRFGTEWRVWDFRIRGGFGYYASPYKDNINDGKTLLFSGGFGYRGKHLFADLTYVGTKTKVQYYLYDPNLVNPADISNYNSSVVMTWGVRF